MSTPTPALRPLVDCSPCDGRGVMTARSVGDPGPGKVQPCPACDGKGAFVVVRDLTGRL